MSSHLHDSLQMFLIGRKKKAKTEQRKQTEFILSEFDGFVNANAWQYVAYNDEKKE